MSLAAGHRYSPSRVGAVRGQAESGRTGQLIPWEAQVGRSRPSHSAPLRQAGRVATHWELDSPRKPNCDILPTTLRSVARKESAANPSPFPLAFPFSLAGTNGRKVTGSDDDDDDEEENVSESDAGDDGEFKVPTSLKTGSRKRAPPTAKADGPNKRKKNGTAATAAAGRRGAAGRKKKAAAGDGDEDVGPRAKTGAGASAVKIGKDFKISDDNEIFSASFCGATDSTLRQFPAREQELILNRNRRTRCRCCQEPQLGFAAGRRRLDRVVQGRVRAGDGRTCQFRLPGAQFSSFGLGNRARLELTPSISTHSVVGATRASTSIRPKTRTASSRT